MTVALILRGKGSTVETVRPEMPVPEIVLLLHKRRIGCVVVTDSRGEVRGILSERDVIHALAGFGAKALERRAEDIMTRDVVTCRREDSAEDLMEMMTRGRFRHVPVVEEGRLLGIVSIGDIVKRRIEDADLERHAMRDYIATAGT